MRCASELMVKVRSIFADSGRVIRYRSAACVIYLGGEIGLKRK